jgi:hypothetical protein
MGTVGGGGGEPPTDAEADTILRQHGYDPKLVEEHFERVARKAIAAGRAALGEEREEGE